MGLSLAARVRYRDPTPEQREVAADVLPERVGLLVSSPPDPLASGYQMRGVGGTVVVRQDCFERLPDDQLAAMMSHEVGHVVQGHSLVGSAHTAFAATVSVAALSAASLPVAAISFVAYTAATAPFYGRLCRQQEFAADAHAVRETGRDGTVSLLETVRERRGGSTRGGESGGALRSLLRQFRTHPSLTARLERVRDQ